MSVKDGWQSALCEGTRCKPTRLERGICDAAGVLRVPSLYSGMGRDKCSHRGDDSYLFKNIPFFFHLINSSFAIRHAWEPRLFFACLPGPPVRQGQSSVFASTSALDNPGGVVLLRIRAIINETCAWPTTAAPERARNERYRHKNHSVMLLIWGRRCGARVLDLLVCWSSGCVSSQVCVWGSSCVFTTAKCALTQDSTFVSTLAFFSTERHTVIAGSVYPHPRNSTYGGHPYKESTKYSNNIQYITN